MVGHSMGGDISMYFAKEYPDKIKKVVTLDNLRVPFMTDGKFKILSFRSKDPVFKTDPGVVPDAEHCEKTGITVVETGYQHNDMSDTGPDTAKSSIEACSTNSSTIPTVRSRRSRPTRRRSPSPVPWRSTHRSRTERRGAADRRPVTKLAVTGCKRGRRRIDHLLVPVHIRLAAIGECLCPANPSNPKSAGAVSSAQKAEPGKAGRLPEATPSASEDIAAFVAKARAMSPHAAGARGRLVFALDATMSRQPTWDMACALQADMFREAAALGSLDIRLVYYRGLNECRATGWISDSAQLAKLMGKIDCRGGNTQIGKVLSEARREAVASAVRAVVFVGDAMEEAIDDLCAKAGELGLLKVPVFMFQEGHDAVAEQAFREIARLTGGAWCRFDPGAAAQLRELLRAAAAYAAGGREALLRLSKTGSGAAKLLGQMK